MPITSLPFSIRELASRQPSNNRDSKVLAANVAKLFLVPLEAKLALFSSTADFWADESATAVVGIDSTDGSSADLNPAAWELNGVTQISVIAASVCTVNISWYS